MKPSLQHNPQNTMAATEGLPEAVILAGAATLAQSIQASAKWRELLNAQKAGEADGRFAQMAARHSELARLQNTARGRGRGLDGKSLVEFIALQDQIQHCELYVRQQEAGSALVRLLQRINEKISEELGLDFASNAAPRRGGCCG
jgi:cell fate (sporulation/competence/biofilm development) regulator YlbF (YheA/YmcA/DUF963 family)